MNDALREAYAHCAAITRRRARNFYYGLRLTPEPKRSALYSVYAWMRRADDSVDEAGDPEEKRARLDQVRRDLERVLDGGTEAAPAADPVLLALAHTVESFELDRQDLRHLLRGLETDLELEARSDGSGDPLYVCDSESDLEAYCYDVASTVGRISVTIWGLRPGVDREHALALAARRGYAFQFTNVLRDFAEDYDEGRIYLPGSAFREAGITPSQLRAWDPAEASEALIRSIGSRAREHYDGSASLDALLDPASLPAMRTMTRIYAGLLDLIEADPSRIVGPKRVRLQSVTKAGIAIRSVIGSWRAEREPAPAP